MESQVNSIASSPPSTPTTLSNIFEGFAKSQALFAASELGVFDFLQASQTGQSGKTIADKLSTDVGSTCRLLDTLVALNLLTKDTASEPQLYQNSAIAEQFLVKTSPKSLHSYLEFLRATDYKLFFNLKEAITEGSNQWQRAFNRSSAEIFASLFNSKTEVVRFLSRLDCAHRLEAPGVISAFDIGSFAHMCDLGGGSGCFAYEACRRYPRMRITVFELPQVMEVSSHFKPSLADCPNQSNVNFVAGNFFVDPLPSADLYLLAHILHDWSEEKVDLILTKVFDTLPPGGGILLGEVLLYDDKTGPISANVMDLRMLVTCGSGARDRSGSEYKQLLEKHGFVDVQTKFTGEIGTDAVFARKP